MNVLGNIDPIDVIREELWSHRHNFSVDEVDEITLLSIEEVRQLPKDILRVGMWWWLRSPGRYQYTAAAVTYGGIVYDSGTYVSNDYLGVRPVFRINNLKLLFGEKVYIGKTLCIITIHIILIYKIHPESPLHKGWDEWVFKNLTFF